MSLSMDLRVNAAVTCSSSFLCCASASPQSDTWLRSLKRKIDGMDTVTEGFARVDIDDEVAALREAIIDQQQSIQVLRAELEEERSAAASAATEAMSMILRLQREKAEGQMEARQFKRLAEEKMAHNQQEIAVLEELIFKREQAILALSCEIEAYRHRFLSCGISIDDAPSKEPMTPDTATDLGAQFDFSCYDYASLRCGSQAEDAPIDLEKYPFGRAPSEQLQNLEERIIQLERMPTKGTSGNVMEKRIVVGRSPPQTMNIRRLSLDSCVSPLEFCDGEEIPVTLDRTSDFGVRDDMNDRIYTVDTMHVATVDTSQKVHNLMGMACSDEELEIRKLYMRLEALEVDRASMRQTLISLGTDKTQAVFLKEISDQLYKDVASEKRIVKKPSFFKRFSIMLVVKCVVSFVRRRKQPSRIRYNFGLSATIVGLLLLLHKSAHVRNQRFFTRIQGGDFQIFPQGQSEKNMYILSEFYYIVGQDSGKFGLWSLILFFVWMNLCRASILSLSEFCLAKTTSVHVFFFFFLMLWRSS